MVVGRRDFSPIYTYIFYTITYRSVKHTQHIVQYFDKIFVAFRKKHIFADGKETVSGLHKRQKNGCKKQKFFAAVIAVYHAKKQGKRTSGFHIGNFGVPYCFLRFGFLLKSEELFYFVPELGTFFVRLVKVRVFVKSLQRFLLFRRKFLRNFNNNVDIHISSRF